MSTAPTQKQRGFAVSTSLADDVLLFHTLRGGEQLNRLFRYDLELLSEKSDINLDEVVGESMTVRIDLDNGKTRYFNGVVSRFAQVGYLGDFVSYEATLVPWLWFLTRTADCRIFPFELTVPKIIQQVFKDFGFAGLVESRLSGEYREWPYCVQYRETAFNFVSRLMENEGIYYYFQHEKDKHKLVLADSIGSHSPFPDFAQLAYQPTPSETGDPFIQTWAVGRQVQPGKYTQNDYDFTNPRKRLQTTRPIKRNHANADYEIFDYPGAYSEYKDGENYSRVRIEELQAQHEIFHGSSVTRGIVTGCLFDFVEFPRDDQNQEYLITGTTHEIVGDAYDSSTGEQQPMFSCSLTATKASEPYRPARITPKPVIQGPQTATVVGPDGEEIHTDKYGRIKVKFHWDRYYENAENSACWIRVAQVWAGSQWGSVTIPRIGQEVMVEFCEGDPDRPLVTGRVYNNDQMPPYKASGGESVNGNISGLMSNTTPGGGGYNELIMDDTKSKELIRLHAQYDMDSTIEHDDRQTIHNNRTITVDGTHTETITKDTTIKITEGVLVHDVEKGTADYHVKSHVTEKFDATQKTTVNNEIEITSKAAHIHLTAKTQIQLEVGKSKLLMKEDGSIQLSGMNIAVDGKESVSTHGGDVTSKADVNHITKGAQVLSEAKANNTVKGGMIMLNP